MKNLLKIHGTSDDLILVDGNASGEFNYTNGEVNFKVSDGTKGIIEFKNDWLITVTEEGSGFNRVIEGRDEMPHIDIDAIGCSTYSEVLIIDGGEWVEFNGNRIE